MKTYGCLQGMLRKYDRYARQDAFCGTTLEEWQCWKEQSVEMLKKLLGTDRMESCPLQPVVEAITLLAGNVSREKIRIQVEPETWLVMYLLIPQWQSAGCVIALPGHGGAGKFSVAGCQEEPLVKAAIEKYHYDYGMKLARMGCVVVCPDARGFGERREEEEVTADVRTEAERLMGCDCTALAHMAEPLGMTVAGMLAFDVSRVIDYLVQRAEWDLSALGCMGFSGGGMQTLWTAILDERIKRVMTSGYLYGCRDSLLKLNRNCSCNYVPHLWEHFDMGDLASMIAPRPFVVQSAREDRLNGERGLDNVAEQLAIVREAYRRFGCEDNLIWDIREGGHCFHEEILTSQAPFA